MMKIDLDKIKANKSKFLKKWLLLLMLFVKLTNNNLYVASKLVNFCICSTRKLNPIMIRVPITLLLNLSIAYKTLKSLIQF